MSGSSTADLRQTGLFRSSVLEESDAARSGTSAETKSGALAQGQCRGLRPPTYESAPVYGTQTTALARPTTAANR
jgi:hypothetical protein